VIGRDDDHALPVLAGSDPGSVGLAEDLDSLAVPHPAVLVVFVDDTGVLGSKPAAGDRLPALLEAVYRRQLRGLGVGDQEAEHAARFDRAELAVIADEDHLGPVVLGDRDQLRQVAGGSHGRLIADDDRPGLSADLPVAVRL
jgi:hypothetical protein